MIFITNMVFFRALGNLTSRERDGRSAEGPHGRTRLPSNAVTHICQREEAMSQKLVRLLIPVILVSICALGELYGFYRRLYAARIGNHI